MTRYVTTRSADGSSTGGGLSSTQLPCHVEWTCLIHCFPWTQDYGSKMTIKLPWGCYDAFDIRFSGFRHRNCCYENNYCFMVEMDGSCLNDNMQNWMCHTCANCFARGSWESSGSCHTMRTSQCCCTSGYGEGCVAYNVRLNLFKDSSRNCNSPAVTSKASGLGYTMCHWNHCDNYGCAIGKWGNGCLHCLVQYNWPGWCCGSNGTWTGIMIKNSCGYMEPANEMSYWSVYGKRNPNITGSGTPAPGLAS